MDKAHVARRAGGDDGRQCAVVRDLQHAFEMLLKAALREKNVRVFDNKSGRSIGF